MIMVDRHWIPFDSFVIEDEEAFDKLVAEAIPDRRPQPGRLTEDEFTAMNLLGELANVMCKIIGTGKAAPGDWAECVDKIHQLQQTVMSQCAARTYPAYFRPLGGWPDG